MAISKRQLQVILPKRVNRHVMPETLDTCKEIEEYKQITLSTKNSKGGSIIELNDEIKKSEEKDQ